MIHLPTVEELKSLTAHRGDPSVSIFCPTHRAGPDIRQDPIRFKNLLTKARELLKKRVDHLSGEIREKLERAEALIEDDDFWRHQREGLALFFSEDVWEIYRLPFEVEEFVEVSDSFHTKPLIPILTKDRWFYVLALSQGEVRLLRGTRFSVQEVELHNVPESLADAMKYDQQIRSLQQHTETYGPQAEAGGGLRPAVFHGHGVVGDEVHKDQILRFFRKVDKGLREILTDESAPLIVAAVEFLHPIYREVNTYKNLLDDRILGNPEPWSADDLHAKAWKVLEPHFEAERKQGRERFEMLGSNGKAATDIREILQGAVQNRVETLFVARAGHLWGSFDPATGQAEVHEEAKPESVDLLNQAAIQTFLNGGEVYNVEPSDVPGGGLAAATFRF